MTPLRIGLIIAAAAIPALAIAQPMDPAMPMPGMATQSKTQAEPRRTPSPSAAQTRPHAGHGAGVTGQSASGAVRPQRSGVARRTAPSARAPHARMDSTGGMDGMGRPPREMPNPPPPPAALSGPAHAADLVYGPTAMASARDELRTENGGSRTYRVLVDRLETLFQRGGDGYRWDAQGWYGGDLNKLWLKSEGSGAYGGNLERGEIQALWSRAISPYFDLQTGVRYDFAPGTERTHAALGLQGLMPYLYNVEGTLFLSNKGELTGRFKADYDLLITQRLILQPRVEFNLSAQNIAELGIGSGLSSIESGLRLRYQFIPEFAPYLGVEYERKVGNTASFARANGKGADSFRYLIGLRSWF